MKSHPAADGPVRTRIWIAERWGERDFTMQFVITGSRGFIGRAVCRRFTEHGIKVIGIIRPGQFPGHEDGIRFHQADLSNPATLLPDDCLNDEFILIHLAWDVRRRRAFVSQAQDVALLAGLLDYWGPRNLRGLVSAGSAEEYATRGGYLREDDPPIGEFSPYGWGKRAAHDLARTWWKESGISVSWIRPFTVYGPGQMGDMLIPYAVRRALSGQSAYFTDGTQQRDFVHVDDVAAAFHAAAILQLEGFHVVNIGTGEPVAIRDVLGRLARHFGAEDRFRFGALRRRPAEPDLQAAETEVAARLLDWRARVPLEEGLLNLIQSMKEAGPWTD
jgi:nucleoside-diphosphate-sugar epimerase